MDLQNLQKDIVDAMKAKDALMVSVLRMLSSEIKNQEISLRGSGKVLDQEELMKVVNKEAKKRRESIEIFKKAGRNELAEKEEAELKILKEYLPEQLSIEDVKKAVKEISDSLENPDFAMLMKASMEKLKGKADGKVVSEIVKKHLGS